MEPKKIIENVYSNQIIEYTFSDMSEYWTLVNAVSKMVKTCKNNTVISVNFNQNCRMFVCFDKVYDEDEDDPYLSKTTADKYFYQYIAGSMYLRTLWSANVEITNFCFSNYDVMKALIQTAIKKRINVFVYMPVTMNLDDWNEQLLIYASFGFDYPVKTNKTMSDIQLEYDVIILSWQPYKIPKSGITSEMQENLIQKVNQLRVVDSLTLSKKTSPTVSPKNTIPVEILFNGNKEILNVVSRHDPFLESMQVQSLSLCPIFNAKINLGKKLGEGNNGVAYEVTVDGYGTKSYVIKKTEAEVDLYSVIGPITDKIYEGIFDEIGVSKKWIQTFNSSTLLNTYGKISIMVPFFAVECRNSKDRIFKAIPETQTKTEVIVPSNSYICKTKEYSEYYIGAMVGEAYRTTSKTDFCINFYNVFSMFTCPNVNDVTLYDHYTFMDKITGEYKIFGQCNLDSLLNKNKFETYIRDAVFIQLMFAIAYYQEKYQLSHNDLHTRNVFIECVTNQTEYRHQMLDQYAYFHYAIGNENLYFPAIPVLVKIGDFGLSVKYSEPIVGDEEVFEEGYDIGDGWGPWIPNYFIPQYDAIFAGFYYVNTLHDSNVSASPFITECMRFLAPGLAGHTAYQMFIDMGIEGLRSEKSGRPKLAYLFQCKTAKELLQSDIVKRKFPLVVSDHEPSSPFITLGSMS